MEKISFELIEIFNATPEEIFEAWLDSDKHTEMTGSPAMASKEIDGKFTAWEDYIAGTNLEIEPYQKIKQSWRTREFDTSYEDSIVEILLTPTEEGTELKLIHTHIPPTHTGYKQGWIDFYFEPMKEYFS
jgi:uncharacterized protein YndB with AHSA1/START domain